MNSIPGEWIVAALVAAVVMLLLAMLHRRWLRGGRSLWTHCLAGAVLVIELAIVFTAWLFTHGIGDWGWLVWWPALMVLCPMLIASVWLLVQTVRFKRDRPRG